jgi:hypothetical protein
MSTVSKNLASFTEELTAPAVKELTESEIAQVVGGLEAIRFR